jgi:hypothetical protein
VKVAVREVVGVLGPERMVGVGVTGAASAADTANAVVARMASAAISATGLVAFLATITRKGFRIQLLRSVWWLAWGAPLEGWE